MNQQKKGPDIINMLLEDCILAFPLSSFIISIYQQYQQRGWLTKKQLEGLYGKASKINGLPPGRLAALEAQIKKMPTRYKSSLPENKPLFEKDVHLGKIIEAVLEKYPQHKRLLYLQSKYHNHELSNPECDEIRKFGKKLFPENND